MGFIAWIFLGGLAGWIASMLMETDDSQGLFFNIVVGIVGAMLGGFVFNFFGEAGVTGFNFYSLLVAVIGSAILLWVVKVVRN